MAKPRQEIPAELLITPDPFTPKFKILVKRDTTSGITGLFATTDGVTFTPFVPAPTSKDKPGAILTLQEVGGAAWQSPSVPSLKSTKKLPVFLDLTKIGALNLNDVFGYFKVPSGLSFSLTEVQLVVADVADTPIRVDVINNAGVAQGRVATIRAGQLQGTTIFNTPLTMGTNTVWKMRILEAGTIAAPGENLAARWVLTGL